MSSETASKSFRPIILEFVAKGGGESFDIFIQSDSENFVKFASTDPKH